MTSSSRSTTKSDVSIDVASRVCSFRTELRKYCSTFSLRGTVSRAKPTKKWPGFHNSRSPPSSLPPSLPVAFSFEFFLQSFSRITILRTTDLYRKEFYLIHSSFPFPSRVSAFALDSKRKEFPRILILLLYSSNADITTRASTFLSLDDHAKRRVEYDKPVNPVNPLITTTDRPSPIQSTKQCASYVFCARSRNPNYKGDPD